MQKLFLMLTLAAFFSSCASVFPGAQPWARVMFAPDKAAHEKACTSGAYYGISKRALNEKVDIDFQPLVGKLSLWSSLGKTYFFCNAIGSIVQRRPDTFPIFSTQILVTDEGLVPADVKLMLSLEDEKGQEFAQMQASDVESEPNKVWFQFDTVNDTDKANLDKTASFTIILTRKGIEEKYKVTQETYPALTSSPRDTSDLNLTSKNPQKNLVQLENGLMARESAVLNSAVGIDPQ
jgi:hypothetical protein